MADTDLVFRATLDSSGFASGMQGLESSMNRLGVQTGTISTNLGGLGTALGTLANPMTAVAAAATMMVTGLAAAVNVASNFESAMSRVASVSGANAQELKAMSDAAREAGATTTYSASQAADAMYFLASSGMSATQQIAALPETLNLAAAGGLELASAAEIVTNTLSQYKLAAGDTGRVSNVLAAASAATNTDVSQLGAAMQNVGPMAASLGMSIEDTAAAMGIFANSGVKGAEAGTALKSMLGSLLGPSKEAAGALGEMGLTVDDINPAMNSYDDIMTKLNDAHMTAGQSVKIFGKEMASNAVIAVQGAGSFDTLKEKITGTNKAAEMAAQMTDNMKGAWSEFTSAAEEAGISVGNILLPVLTDTIKLATGFVSSMTDAGKSVYAFYKSFQSNLAGWDDALLDMFGIEKMEPAASNAGEVSAQILADNFQDNVPPEAFDELDSSLTKAGEKAGADAGTVAAEEFANQFQEQAGRSGLSSETLLGFINSQSTPDSSIQEYVFNVHDTAVKFWYDAEEKVPLFHLALDEKEVMSTTERGTTPEKMLAALGLPVPDQGTVDYYRMKGDEVRAKILEVQQQMAESNQWDTSYTPLNWAKWRDVNADAIEKIPGELESVLYNAGAELKETGDQTLSESLNNVMSALVEPGKINGDILNDSISNLIDAGVISPKWGSVIEKAANEAVSTDFVVDKGKALQTKFEELGETAGNALKDGIITVSEQEALTEIVASMSKLGYEGGNALADGVKDQNWSEVGQIAGEQTGDAFTQALEAAITGKPIDIASLGITNLDRYLTSQIDKLESSLKPFAEGATVPEENSAANQRLMQIYEVLNANKGSLDSQNTYLLGLLENAKKRGGGQAWERLYAFMGLLDEDAKNAGNTLINKSNQAGISFSQQMPTAAKWITDSSQQFQIRVDESGQKWAQIGSIGTQAGNDIKNGAVAGANSLSSAASAINAAASNMRNAASSLGSIGASILGGAGGSYTSQGSSYSAYTSTSTKKGYFDDPWMNQNLKLPRYAKGGYVGSEQAIIAGDVPGGEWVVPNEDMRGLSESINYLGGCVESSFGHAQERKGAGLFYSDSSSVDMNEWAKVYDNNGSCIAYVPPDDTLNFIPGRQTSQALNRDAWNAIYDNKGTCVAFAEPDPSLKFTPGTPNQSYVGPTSGYSGYGSQGGVTVGSSPGYSFQALSSKYDSGITTFQEAAKSLGSIASSITGGALGSNNIWSKLLGQSGSLGYTPGYGTGYSSNSSGGFNFTNQSQFHPFASQIGSSTGGAISQWAEQSSKLLSYTAESFSESMYDCECAISDFAKAQETATGLFYESYIGPTEGWAGAGLGARSGSSSGSGGGSLDDWGFVREPGITPLEERGWWQEIERSGDPWAGSRASSGGGWDNPGTFGGGWSFANEGYAGAPMLAMIGDRPGGEYVMGADRLERLESMISGRSGAQITVNMPPITINGSGLSAEELEAVTSSVVSKAVDEVTDKINEAVRGL